MEAVWVDTANPIPVPFDTKGATLFKGTPDTLGLPAEAFLRLVAVEGNKREVLPSVGDLKGRVGISTPDQALAFARLLASPDTHYLFRELGLYEPPDDAFDQEYRQKVGLLPAKASREGGDFLVERNLVRRDRRLVRSRERIMPDGGWEQIDESTLDQRSPVPFPFYQ